MGVVAFAGSALYRSKVNVGVAVCFLGNYSKVKMDTLVPGPLYCAEQIKIPATMPDILKEFTKAAIRTQPADVLQWSAAYFEALSKGVVPPVKGRLEANLPPREERVGGLSRGALAVMHRQLDGKERVSQSIVEEKWRAVGCAQGKLEELLAIGNMTEDIEWLHLLALACTALENATLYNDEPPYHVVAGYPEESLPGALTALCEVLTSDPHGGPARIPVKLFHRLYSFLADIDGQVSNDQINSVMLFLNTEAERFNGKVGPRDFLHNTCPKLDSS